MSNFLSTAFSYIWNNKKYELPHIFTFPILLTIMLIPISKGILFLLYSPFFFWFGFRAWAKAETDGLHLGYLIFLLTILPFITGFIFAMAIIIFNAYTGINPYKLIGGL